MYESPLTTTETEKLKTRFVCFEVKGVVYGISHYWVAKLKCQRQGENFESVARQILAFRWRAVSWVTEVSLWEDLSHYLQIIKHDRHLFEDLPKESEAKVKFFETVGRKGFYNFEKELLTV